MPSYVNDETVSIYRKKMSELDRRELEEAAAKAFYHLQVLSGSRNSFIYSQQADAPTEKVLHPHVERSPQVEAMHREAYEFLKPYMA